MNIHITCTPEFSVEKLEEIVSLLISIPGELKFIKGKPWTQVQYKRLNEKFANIEQISSLKFEEFFDLVQGYREFTEIDDDDFVILISSIKNSRNWFSAFNKKNIFIHGDEWDLISDVDSKFGLAYQCVGNVFHSLLDLKISDFHRDAGGCISDLCGYKPDILKKLQSANICQSCYERSVSKGISDFVMTHIISIMEEIRREFVIAKRYSRKANLEIVKVDTKGIITVGDKVIKMDLLPRVLYIFFLKNLKGINTNKICENEKQVEKVYRKLKKNPDEYAIRKMCCDTIEYPNHTDSIVPTFLQYRSKITKALNKALGLTLANYYHIKLVEDHNDKIYMVNLTPDYLDMDVRFRD